MTSDRLPLNERMQLHAVPFLASLLGCSFEEAKNAPMTWQTFPDPKKGITVRNPGKLTRMFHGTLREHYKHMEDLNKAGAGIFVTVNETNLEGRKKEDIIGLRGVWADLDEKDATKPAGELVLPLTPTMQVCSGHGGHDYWMYTKAVEATPESKDHQEAQLKAIQRTLAPFGADPKVCECARVMRTPGFYNMKGEPFPLVSLVMADGPRYNLDKIQEAFPASAQAGAMLRTGGRVLDGPRHQEEESLPTAPTKILKAKTFLERCPPAISDHDGHNTTFKVAIQTGPGFDLDEETTFQLLWEAYNPKCQPPWSEKELRHKVEDAFKKEPRRGFMLRGKGNGRNHILRSLEYQDDQDPTRGGGDAQKDDPNKPCFGSFILNTDGLFHRELVGEQVALMRVSDTFEVLAEIRSPANTGWGIRVSWFDRDGVQHSKNIPREAVTGDGSEVIRLFVGGGLLVKNRRYFLEYLAGVTHPSRARSVERIGWHQSMFVLPDQTFGNSPEPVFLDLEQDHNFHTAGSLQDWRTHLGRFASGNSRLTFGISLSFSAALLAPVRMESGGFNIFGPSSTGKTTCAEVAGSVWGGPRFNETWRATSNGLESVALAHNDSLLVLDEQGQADPKECGEIIYMLANGVDKVRATKTLENRARRHWRVATLSTGEVTLADKMREIGKKSKAGQAVRLIDIPACPLGLNQVIEDLHGMESSQALVNYLKSSSQKYYGTPICAFLTRLSGLPQEVVEMKVRERMRQWKLENVPAGSDSQVARTADRFALAAVAGELARVWGIVPWSSGEADRAAVACFRSWLTHRGGVRSSEQQEGIRGVLDFIDKHGQSRFMDKGRPNQKVVDMAGWRDMIEDKKAGTEYVDYLFTPTGWEDACEGFNAHEVARAMLQEGLLNAPNRAGGQKTQKKVRIGLNPKWVYYVPGSAISAYREREASTNVLFPCSNEPGGEGTPQHTSRFFDEPWMFPRSIQNSGEGSTMTLTDMALFLGATVIGPGEVMEARAGGITTPG